MTIDQANTVLSSLVDAWHRHDPASASSTVTGVALRPDFDLAAHRPGQAARMRARELRDAAPVRTW